MGCVCCFSVVTVEVVCDIIITLEIKRISANQPSNQECNVGGMWYVLSIGVACYFYIVLFEASLPFPCKYFMYNVDKKEDTEVDS